MGSPDLVVPVLFGAFLLMGLVFVVLAGRTVQQLRRRRNWLVVPGLVAGGRWSHGSDTDTYHLRMRYPAPDGRERELWSRYGSNVSWAPEGTVLQVRVNPADFDDAVLARFRDSGAGFAVLAGSGGTVFTLVGAVGLAVRYG